MLRVDRRILKKQQELLIWKENSLSFPFCTGGVTIIRNSIMPISYELRRYVLDSKNAVSIDEEEYKELCHAQDVLLHALFIEEKLDLLLENFVEYENELLSIGLSRMVFQRTDHAEFRNDVNSVNRRIVNLLSACRAYLDSLPHHVNQICSPSKVESETLKKMKYKQYDSVFGYRVMEELRNYAQHRGSPVQSSSFSERAEWRGEKQVKVFTVDPFLETKQLSQDGNFKKKILCEIKRQGDTVDLKPLVRQYISSIREIHEQARKLVSDYLMQQRKTLESALKAINGCSISGGGVAVTIADDGLRTDIVPLSPEPERQIEILIKRNPCIQRIDDRFVSGVCENDAGNEPDET